MTSNPDQDLSGRPQRLTSKPDVSAVAPVQALASLDANARPCVDDLPPSKSDSDIQQKSPRQAGLENVRLERRSASATGDDSHVEVSIFSRKTDSYTDDVTSHFTSSNVSALTASSSGTSSFSPHYTNSNTDQKDTGAPQTDLSSPGIKHAPSEHELEEAAVQAEDGIVAEESGFGGDYDDGYESGESSHASTSLASSLWDFPFENGRRYHKFREGRYNFPNDDPEQEREDMKHMTIKMLCQGLFFAPIGDSPQQILDLGTGTGIWAIEMGDKFPTAVVLGIDLSPIQPEWVPPNVRFMVDDAESEWLHPKNHFDYIHSRHLIMAIKDWPRLLEQAFEHLRPGGWIEMQEIRHYPESVNNSMSRDHPVAQYWGLIDQGLGNLGIEFLPGPGRLAEIARDGGFVNVTERVLQVPIGTWPKNKSLKAVGLYWRTILLEGIQAIALGPLTRGCGWSSEQVEIFLVQVRKAYYDNSSQMYMPLHVVYAQKPYHLG